MGVHVTRCRWELDDDRGRRGEEEGARGIKRGTRGRQEAAARQESR